MRFILTLWILLLPFCFINLTINVFVVSSHCLSHEKSALLHLRNNLEFNPSVSKKLVHWNQTQDCCLWNGITCDHGNVIALDLSGESISSGLENSNSGIFNLNNNNITSSVPKNLVGLSRLTTLQLRNCNLTGVFPEQIFQMPNLQFLDVSDNQDLQGSLPNFPYHGFLQVSKPGWCR